MDDWKYGDVVRRAITMNPVIYTKVMYLGPSKWPHCFAGLRLTELPPPSVGTAWVNNAKPGDIQSLLKRSLYELDHE